MFSSNQKISPRQTFRLFTFDFVGISSLIVPPYLARTAGCDGWICILAGGLAGFVYLCLLAAFSRGMQTDLLTYMHEHLPEAVRILVSGFLVFHCVVLASFCTYVFAILMQQSLVQEEHYWLIVLVVLAAAGYAVSGGIESRARVYEVLFWFVFLPLLIMLAVGAKDVEPVYWEPMLTATAGQLAKGSYAVFLFFGTAFWMLFFPKYLSPKHQGKKLTICVSAAMLVTEILLLLIYQIVLGNFGSGSLSHMDFPVITLMSTIRVSGNFVKRFDALMLGVWFFTLLALLNLHLFYGAKMAQEVTGGDGNKRYIAAILAVVACAAVLFGNYAQWMQQWFFSYILYVGTPALVLLPLVIWLIGRGRKR